MGGCFSQCERITVREVDLEPSFLFLAVLGLHFCEGFSLAVVRGLLTVVASLLAERGPQQSQPLSLEQGLSGCGARAQRLGGLPGSGLDPCLLCCWQMLHHSLRGRPWRLVGKLRAGRGSSKNRAGSP